MWCKIQSCQLGFELAGHEGWVEGRTLAQWHTDSPSPRPLSGAIGCNCYSPSVWCDARPPAEAVTSGGLREAWDPIETTDSFGHTTWRKFP